MGFMFYMLKCILIDNLYTCTNKRSKLPVVLKYVCVCMTRGKRFICHSMHVAVRGNLGELFLSFHL